MKRFIPFAIVFTIAACGKGVETAQAPRPASAPQTASQAAPPPVTAPEPAQTTTQSQTSEPAMPATGQSSGFSGSSGASASSSDYTVAKGDTLHGIAREHGVNDSDIANWNNIKDPNRIHAGQILRLTPP